MTEGVGSLLATTEKQRESIREYNQLVKKRPSPLLLAKNFGARSASC
jgi:hypothetical protein